MPTMQLTSQQQRAVTTVDRSLIVSAAAGSGKTSVLAERCAYLVCDAPPDCRCDVEQLLVLTYTDAAAAQMRGRIAEAIRARSLECPDDDRLREQAALVDAARISTIHSFCLWVIRRWFSDAGVDPGAVLLDGDESALLQREVIEELFSALYASRTDGRNGSVDDDPLGGAEAAVARDCEIKPAPQTAEPQSGAHQAGELETGKPETGTDAETDLADAIGPAFTKLVDDYGLGEDRAVGELVLKLAGFVTSLPQPDAWLDEAKRRIIDQPEGVVLELLDDLRTELAWQSEYCTTLAEALMAGDVAGHFQGEQIEVYTRALDGWASALSRSTTTGAIGDKEHAAAIALFDEVRLQIAEFAFSRKRAPKVAEDDEVGLASRKAAQDLLKEVREKLFSSRLEKRFCLFSGEEWLEGLGKIGPYIETIADLVETFRRKYSERKRQLGVLDFSDLERFAFDLLHVAGEPETPSDIARALQRRFEHVLVDEFQDINPLQQAIIELVSRETDPDRPGNLFTVGDVKQSIYRFRLAEPALFIERLDAFREPQAAGEAIHLQANFRSRGEILEAVNLVFRQLMRREVGGVHYDREAELSPGRAGEPGEERQPVELHLLERKVGDHRFDEASDERGLVDPLDPMQWSPIQREAFLIGSRIRELVESGGMEVDGRPLCYRDIAVLLRAVSINAEKMASVFSLMDIPAYADVGGSLFDALEIRDVLSALSVLDNAQQDIPLAAVLRSGVFGQVMSEDDLVEIRCLDRDIPFHEAVREYARCGRDEDVTRRLRIVLGRGDRYRERIRRRPLAEVLWGLYDETGYLAYAGGLPNGRQRRANLLKLHERARQFGAFRKQGLHRFLRFIEMLKDQKQDLGSAPALGEAEDVVTIMSVHHSKGLEFPVVVVAGLGTKFNLGDRSGRMIFERDAGIGLKVVDPERMIEYPSAAHLRVGAEVERHTRAEELRILYVAMTRAKEKLILVGSMDGLERISDGEVAGGGRRLTPFAIATAMTPLDWLVPVLRLAPSGTVRWPEGNPADQPVIEVHTHHPEQMARWRLDKHTGSARERLSTAIARCEPLPPAEPRAPDDARVEEVLARMDYAYPSLTAASVRAVVAAGEFKGEYDYLQDRDERTERMDVRGAFTVPPSKYAAEQPADALRRGIVTHRVLEHMCFENARRPGGVASELQRMVDAGLISAGEQSWPDLAAIEWFVSTPLARAICSAGDGYRREFSFITAEAPGLFDPLAGSLDDDTVLVRGIVDGVLPVDGGIEIVDFKTDAITSREVELRCEHHRPQMTMYSRAMERIWRRKVLACRLVFLSAREVGTLIAR